MAHFHDYAFAVGWDVVLASLRNVEETFGARNRHPESNQLMHIGIRSQPVDFYPIVTDMESGRVRGDGKIPHLWQMQMFASATTYLMSLFTAKSVKWTIYTRLHELDTYGRYNCWAVRPSGDDLVYVGKKLLRVTLRFTDLMPPS
jgi:hypothetical protein